MKLRHIWKYRRHIWQCYWIVRRKKRLNRIWRMNEIEQAIHSYEWNDPALATRLIEIIRVHREIPEYGYAD